MLTLVGLPHNGFFLITLPSKALFLVVCFCNDVCLFVALWLYGAVFLQTYQYYAKTITAIVVKA